TGVQTCALPIWPWLRSPCRADARKGAATLELPNLYRPAARVGVPTSAAVRQRHRRRRQTPVVRDRFIPAADLERRNVGRLPTVALAGRPISAPELAAERERSEMQEE